MNRSLFLVILLPFFCKNVNSQGPCATAGFTDCNCLTSCEVSGCFCDLTCLTFNDCCADFLDICTPPDPQGVTLQVSISSTPEAPPYPAATYIDLRCVVDTILPVTYNWLFYCDDTLVFETGSRPSDSIRLRSTPNTCLNTANCTAQDSSGNTGSAVWEIGATTGVGFWGTTRPLENNSAVIADSLGEIGTIYCHSSSMESNVGRWLSPEREDITLHPTDDFIIVFNEGQFPSYNIFALLPSSSFSSADEGVYTCLVPDENGVEQTLHIGIYSGGYPATIEVPRIQRLSQSPLTIECITTGLPATDAIWEKVPNRLTEDTTFQMYQEMTDAITATYSNRLVINEGLHQARGLYFCNGEASFTGPVQDPAGPNITGDTHFFSIFVPGDFQSLTCSFNLSTWRNTENNQIVSSGGSLVIPVVNDSIHETRYVCEDGVNMNQLFYTAIVNVPDSALDVTATETTSPMVGSTYGVVCLAAKSTSGLINDPMPVWLVSNATEVTPGGGATLNGPVNTFSSSEVTLFFSSLQTSNAGAYLCQGTLNSPALDSPIVKQVQFNITAQIPQPVVSITSTTSPPYSNGNTLTLECAVLVNSAVNTPIDIGVSWTRSGDIITNGGRYMISDVVTNGSFMYRSSLTVSSLSLTTDSGEYSCAVSVNPSLVSPFITASETASASVEISVTGPLLTVDLAPSSVRILDTSPYNSFALTCNSTVADVASVPTTQWIKELEGGSSTTVLAGNGASVNISNTASGFVTTSTISVVETVAGTYIYTCTSSIQQAGNVTVVSVNTTITVQGLLFPLRPANVQATVTSFTSARIDWDVPSIAYTPERYAVRYGTTPQSLGQSITVQGPFDIATEEQHFIVELTGLQHDSTYYYQITATSSAGSTETIVLSFTIEDIPIITAITAVGQPIAGSTFSLVCNVTEEEDVSGIPVAAWLDSTGQNIHSGGDFLITSQFSGLVTTLTLQFAPLRGSHSGEYTCRSELRELSFNESASYSLIVDVAELPVSINSSSTEFLATSPLTLSCWVGPGAEGAVSYRWSSSCTGECFVSAQTTQQVQRSVLRAADSGEHTCTATDELGNTGSGSILITVEGVGFYLSGTGIVNNNTVVLAAPGGTIESLQCISGSTVPNVGQWIAPNGQDITRSNTDPFDTTVGGSANPGHLAISPAAGRTITSSWEGVYTCNLPDQAGAEQVLYIGIYLTPISPSVITIERLANMPIFTLNCSSNRAAASTVTWLKDESILAAGTLYRMYQTLRDGVDSVYDNILAVSTAIPVNSLVGNYTCRVENAFGSGERDITFRGLETSRSQDVFVVGQSASVTCTSDLGVSTVEWVDNNGVVVVSSSGSSAVLEFDLVEDRLHDIRYTCRAMAIFGSQERDINIITEVDADDISVTISSSPIPALLGQDLSVMCTVETPPGLLNIPVIRWQYSDGSEIVTTSQVSVGSQTSSADSVSRTVTFRPLSTAHGEDFICLADVTTSAPPHLISKAAEYDIFIGEPDIPGVPVGVSATDITSTSAVVQWRVPSVSYTQEQYVVRYSLDRDNLLGDARSVTVDGSPDTSLVDQVYMASLTDLRPEMEYYYSISARNSIGIINTNTLSFTTVTSTVTSEVTFQLLLGEINDCNEWRFENTQEKLGDIRSSLLSTIQEQCQCLQDQDEINNAEFTCFDDPKYVVFRATFASSSTDTEQFITSVEELIQSEQVTIVVQSNRLTVDSDCNTRIRSLDEAFNCEAPTIAGTEAVGGVSIGTIVGATVGGCIVLLLIAAFIVVLALLNTQRKRKKFEVSQRQEQTLSTAATAEDNPYANRDSLAALPTTSPPPYTLTHYSSEGTYVKMNPVAPVWSTSGGGGEQGETLYDEIPQEKLKLAEVQFDGTRF